MTNEEWEQFKESVALRQQEDVLIDKHYQLRTKIQDETMEWLAAQLDIFQQYVGYGEDSGLSYDQVRKYLGLRDYKERN